LLTSCARCLLSLLLATILPQAVRADSPIRLVATIALPGVEGRIDHLALDPLHHRLLVAALGSNRVEVIDLARNRRSGEIENLPEPQGVLFLQERERLYVTLGEAAHIAVVNGSDLTSLRRIPTRADPDNIRYEPGADRIWIGEGDGPQGALAAFGPDGEALLFEIALDDHPESFQLQAKGPRIFVNVPGQQGVAVVDREKRTVATRWKLPCSANFPMALDEAHARLFVGCRRPARLVALDTETGRVVAQVDAPRDADDLFLDPATHRIYVSSGEGLVRVYVRRDADHLEVAGDVSTGSGARTSLFEAESRRASWPYPVGAARPRRSRYSIPRIRTGKFMLRYEASASIRAPGESIWPVLSDVVHWNRWTPTILQVEALDGEEIAPGRRFRVHQPRLRPTIWRVTSALPPTRFMWEARAIGTRMTADHVLARTAPEETHLTLAFSFAGVLGGLVGRMTGRLVQSYLDTEAASLRRCSEDGAPGSSPAR